MSRDSTALSSSGKSGDLTPSSSRTMSNDFLPASVRRTRRFGEPVQWNHGLVYAFTQDRRSVIASPNMSFIPQPVYGTLTISLMQDGHFGSADPIHWPQVLQVDTRYPWISVIQRKPSDPTDKRFCMWEPLRRRDFVPLLTSASKGLGTVSSRLIERLRPIYSEPLGFETEFIKQHGSNRELRWLSSTMRHAFDRLDFPATFRDMVRQHACLQRFWLYTVAWLDWYLGHIRAYTLRGDIDYRPLPKEQLMGCFTTSPMIAQRLFDAGVPVWVSRPTESLTHQDLLETPVDFIPPIALLDFGDATVEEKAAYVDLLHGLAKCIILAGDHHIDWINRQSQHYGDGDVFPIFTDQNSFSVAAVSSIPEDASAHQETPAASTSSAGVPARKRKSAASSSTDRTESRNKKARFLPHHAPTRTKSLLTPSEREKFQDPAHPVVPALLPVWRAALAEVDMNLVVPTGQDVWKYWAPEARLVVGSSVTDRVKRFVARWLKIRDVCYYLLTRPPLCQERLKPLKACEWRDYLNMCEFVQQEINAAPNSKRSLQIVAVLKAVAEMLGENKPDDGVPAKWFGNDVESAEGPVWERILVEVAWDLAEVGFRVELSELDWYLVPRSAPDDDLEMTERDALLSAVFPPDRGLVIKTFPTTPDGLASPSFASRTVYLEALRQVLSRWPGVPEELKNCAPLTSIPSFVRVARIEKDLASFYCTTFFRVAGRAPVLPRCMPVHNE